MAEPKDISVVIPVYNSSASLRELVQRLDKSLKSIGKPYELIFVDDYSQDKSWLTLQEILQQYDSLKIVKLSRNFGQHNATICGIHEACGKVIITMDDDLEQPPELIPDLYNQFIGEKKDILYAYPVNRTKGLFRWFLSGAWSKVTKVSKKGAGVGSSFRVLSEDMALILKQHNEPFVYIESLLYTYTNNIGYKAVRFDKRKHGKSNYSISRLLYLQQDISINYSTVMLNYMMVLGSFVSYVSYILIAFYLSKKMLGNPVPGFTTLIVVMLFATGSILKGIGYLGLYVGKMFRILNKEPQFRIGVKMERKDLK